MKMCATKLIFFIAAISIKVISVQGGCIWYGTCDIDEPVDDDGMGMPCIVNDPTPHQLDIIRNVNDTAITVILLSNCPWLLRSSGSSSTVCCSLEQAVQLELKLSLAKMMLSHCPSCWYNFRFTICEMACGPRQRDFLEVTEIVPCTTRTSGGFLPDSTAGLPTECVSRINYYIDDEFVVGTYNSCSEVYFNQTSAPAIYSMCGEHGAHCDPHKWYDFMGTKRPPLNPIQVDYKYQGKEPIVSNGVTYYPLQNDFVPCDVALSVGRFNETACSCRDCSASCTEPPTTVQPPTTEPPTTAPPPTIEPPNPDSVKIAVSSTIYVEIDPSKPFSLTINSSTVISNIVP